MSPRTQSWLASIAIALTTAVANATTWEIVPAVPRGFSSSVSNVSNVSHALGISDNGYVVGTTEMALFAFDGKRFGVLQIGGMLTNPWISGITKGGFVWGIGFWVNYHPWGCDLVSADWQLISDYIVSGCSMWAKPPANDEAEDSYAPSQELSDFLIQHDLTFVAMNANGQVAANGLSPGTYQSNIAFLLNPIFPVSEPSALILILSGMATFAYQRRKRNANRNETRYVRETQLPISGRARYL